MRNSIKYSILAFSIIGCLQANAEKVLIIGDVHGYQEELAEVIKKIKEKDKITDFDYILVNGDMIKSKDLHKAKLELESSLGLLASSFPSISGDKSRLIYATGNWEGALIPADELHKITKDYSSIDKIDINDVNLSSKKVLSITRISGPNNDGAYSGGYVVTLPATTGSSVTPEFNIMFGHFPQFVIPAEALSQEAFMYSCAKEQANVLTTMTRKTSIPDNVNLAVYSHTHVPAAFYGHNTGNPRNVLVINPGSVDLCRRNAWDDNSYAILDTAKREVTMYPMSGGLPILGKGQCGQSTLPKGTLLEFKAPITISLDHRPGTTIPSYDVQDLAISYSTTKFTELAKSHKWFGEAVGSDDENSQRLAARRKNNIDSYLEYLKDANVSFVPENKYDYKYCEKVKVNFLNPPEIKE